MQALILLQPQNLRGISTRELHVFTVSPWTAELHFPETWTNVAVENPTMRVGIRHSVVRLRAEAWRRTPSAKFEATEWWEKLVSTPADSTSGACR